MDDQDPGPVPDDRDDAPGRELQLVSSATAPRPFQPFGAKDVARDLPHNVEAEASLLGALMIANDWLPAIAARVGAEDFYEPIHGRVFEVISREIQAGRTATPVTLRPHFTHDATMASLGGPSYLATLISSLVPLIGAMDMADQVRELAQRRALIRVLQDALDAVDGASGEYAPLPDIVATIDGGLTAAVKRAEVNSVTPVLRAWDDALEEVDAIAEGKVDHIIRADDFPDFNQLVRPRDGDLIVVAARPGMGKTALACRLANCYARAGLGVEFITAEMSVQDLMLRMICDELFAYGTSFTSEDLYRGRVDANERRRIDDYRGTIATWPLYFFKPSTMKLGEVLLEIRRRKRAMEAKGQALKVVIIDYLQLLRADKDRDNLVREIGEITRAFKLLAGELGIAIVLLSQLSRAVEQREDKRPRLSDLRESGSIEQDADSVLFLYREEYYLKGAEPRVGAPGYAEWDIAMQAARDRVELIAAKVRKGATGSRIGYFFGAHQAIRGARFFEQRGNDR